VNALLRAGAKIDARGYADATALMHAASNRGTKACEVVNVLLKAGADVDMVVIEGAEHADDAFVQPEIKQIILDFINKKCK
jgi:ankyrin repeat protein